MTARWIAAAAALLLTPPLAAQAPLALRDALARADTLGYANRAATARTAAAAARVGATGRGLLPSLRVEAGWARSDDPLAAFGMVMRQREVTPQAFDPAALNDPAARSDVSTGLVAEVPLVNLDAWDGRAAAARDADAARASAAWQRAESRLDVIRAYAGAVLAREQVSTLAAADTAAMAHVRAAQSAVSNGLATRSDVLLAQVKEAGIATRFAAASGRLTLARRRLALLLGAPDDTGFTLPATLPSLDSIAPADATPTGRADVRAAAASLSAARAAQRMASATRVPRVNGFARYDWHDASSLAAGRAMWTVGVMASWSLYSGGADRADRRGASAGVEAARAGLDAARANADLELQSAEVAVSVASNALGSAARSVTQAAEAHRIVTRKYAGGLATVSELLDAQAAELGARLGASAAQYDLLVARATLAQARGEDLTILADVIDAADGMRGQ